MRVVLTREEGHNDALRARLPRGAEAIEVPLTRTVSRDHAAVAEEATRDPRAPFASLVVTSARGAPYVDDVVASLRPGWRTYAVGPATAHALDGLGWGASVVGREGAGALGRAVSEGPVLVLAAATTRPELVAELERRGLAAATVACYATEPLVPDEAGRRALRSADVVVIGAPSAWAVARPLVAATAWVLVPGATTGAEVRRSHERVLEGWDGDLAGRLEALEHGGIRDQR